MQIERLRDFYQNALVGMHAFGPDQLFIDVNDHELQMLGYRREEIVGKKRWSDLVIPEQKKRFESHWRHILSCRQVVNIEYTIVRSDGYHLPVLLNATGNFDVDGRLINTRGIVVDISRRKNLERALRIKNEELDKANEKLREADRLKSEFVSRASHELRTPLISIIGFAQTMLIDERGITDEQRRNFLRIIEAEGKRLNMLITDLLDLSKLEIGVVKMSCSRFDLIQMIKETAEMITKPGGFRFEIAAESESCILFADRGRLKQVMINLLNNAFQYGSSGGLVRVTVRTRDREVEVEIHDNGKGISEEDLLHIFEKFYRGAETGKSKGSGLGLAIAREIISEHGGEIRALSQPGKGTSFIFTVPLNPEELK